MAPDNDPISFVACGQLIFIPLWARRQANEQLLWLITESWKIDLDVLQM